MSDRVGPGRDDEPDPTEDHREDPSGTDDADPDPPVEDRGPPGDDQPLPGEGPRLPGDDHPPREADEDPPPDYVLDEWTELSNRAKMVEWVGRIPGINKNRLAKAVGVDHGVITHHLRFLEPLGTIVTRTREDGNEIHCFLPEDVDLWENEHGRFLFGRSGPRAVVLYLAENPGAKSQEIADALGLTVNTIRHHLRTLRDHGAIKEYSVGRTNLYDITEPVREWVEAVGDVFETPWRE